MIDGLDHVVVAVRDLDSSAEGYRQLFGRAPVILTGGGARRAWFQFPNMALELIAPEQGAGGEGPAGDRARAWLEKGEGVCALAFHAPELEATGKLMARRGLGAGEPAVSHLKDERGRDHVLRAVRLDPAATGGLEMVMIGRGEPIHPPEPQGPAPIAALDHVVVTTANPDRALAVYGAKLGLDLRLDRENTGWNARQMFFRCGEAVVEIGARIGGPVSDQPDRFGGLAWRVADPLAAQARIAAAGFDVSEVRTGRKPGTHVFTVRNAPGGIPTIMLSHQPAPSHESA